MSSEKIILYTLPKSRTTQMILGGKKIEKLWERIILFLNNCIDADYKYPKSIDLTCWDDMFEGEDHTFAKQNIENTRKIFGKPGNDEPRYHNGAKLRESQFEWKIQIEDLNKALNYLIEGQPWPKFFMGPTELLITYHFKLIDPKTKIALPNQSESSTILFWLSRNSSCSPLIYFPFETNNEDFYNYLNKIQSFLPFKLEEKYLRFVLKDKNDHYYYRKLNN